MSSARPELPEAVTDRTFEAVVLDWDGLAAGQPTDPAGVGARLEELCAAAVHVFVVSDAGPGDIDAALAARPEDGPGHLHLCVSHGAEVFAVDGAGPHLAWRRTVAADEQEALDRAARQAAERLGGTGAPARVTAPGPDRRRVVLPTRSPDRARVEAQAAEAGRAAGLPEPRVAATSRHVEISLTDRSDGARWAARWLAERGVTGSLVLVADGGPAAAAGAGDPTPELLVPELHRAQAVSVGPSSEPTGDRLHTGGGWPRLVQILEAQLERRRARRVPGVDRDPAWTVPLPGAAGPRAAEALGTLANGWAGNRGALEDGAPGSQPLFCVNGMYTTGPVPQLLAGPRWDSLEIHGGGPGVARQLLDLRTGVLVRDGPAGVRTLRLVSAARPPALALRAEGPVERLRSGAPLAPPEGGHELEQQRQEGVHLGRVVAAPAVAGITTAARTGQRVAGPLRTVERLAAWVADADHTPTWLAALDELRQCEKLGFDNLLAEHREAWAQRWAEAEVAIEGDADDQLAARFAVFHLLASAPDQGEAAVGARGLTGQGYGGHVFWDADVFVLPVLAAIHPAAARAMIEYRVRRLGSARAIAATYGRAGARFPWESAGDGTDVTPSEVTGPSGEAIPVFTGAREEHIVADVAWAASRYADWTGDSAFLGGPGLELLVETARYWASRIRRDAAGLAHIDGVMGPDEYHARVDDNAYTNVMARWNLRRAAALVEGASGGNATTATWRALADALVDGYDPARGHHEQFAGYWELEDLLMADVAPPPVAADVLLGPERVTRSQVIKQADVVMLHQLVPEELAPGSLAADVDYYEPRTSHGSSLSPAIYAAQMARAGRPDDALELFRLAAHLDLADITGTTAGGLHIATMGGVWQALVHGFLGVRLQGPALAIDPCLPGAWDAITVRFRFRGRQVGLTGRHDAVTVTCNEPLDVQLGDQPPQRCQPPGCTCPLRGRSP